MNSQQIETLLKQTARDVKGLLLTKAYRKRFDQYRQAFHEKQSAYIEYETLRNQQKDKYRKQAAKDKRGRNKKAGPPQKGYVWHDESPCETGDPNFGFWGTPQNPVWGPPQKPCLSPELLLMPVAYGGRLPNDETEELEKHYILLLIIYDWKLPDFHLVNENTLDHLVEFIGFYDTDNKQCLIETALANVKADLDLLPREELEAPPNDKAAVVYPLKKETHERNDSYTYIKWDGTEYTFSVKQAKIIKLLWGADSTPAYTAIDQKTIAMHIDTVANNYRLIDSFRSHNKTHPAWGTMIEHVGNGVYTLVKPD